MMHGMCVLNIIFVSFSSQCEEHHLLQVLILDTFEGVLRDPFSHPLILHSLHHWFTCFLCHSLPPQIPHLLTLSFIPSFICLLLKLHAPSFPQSFTYSLPHWHTNFLNVSLCPTLNVIHSHTSPPGAVGVAAQGNNCSGGVLFSHALGS